MLFWTGFEIINIDNAQVYKSGLLSHELSNFKAELELPIYIIK